MIYANSTVVPAQVFAKPMTELMLLSLGLDQRIIDLLENKNLPEGALSSGIQQIISGGYPKNLPNVFINNNGILTGF